MASKIKIPKNFQRMIESAYVEGMRNVQKILLESLMKKKQWNASQLADFLGLSAAAVSGILNKGRVQRASLEKMMDRIEEGITLNTLNSIYSPICELEEIKVGCEQITFKKKSKNVSEQLERLKGTNGVYIFYDSVGKAIYAGRAIDQTLFDEMNKVLVRNRTNAQIIYRQDKGQMRKSVYYIADAAHYISAYDVRPELIPSFEAILVNAFPNDLTNIRMEKHKKIEKLKKSV